MATLSISHGWKMIVPAASESNPTIYEMGPDEWSRGIMVLPDGKFRAWCAGVKSLNSDSLLTAVCFLQEHGCTVPAEVMQTFLDKLTERGALAA